MERYIYDIYIGGKVIGGPLNVIGTRMVPRGSEGRTDILDGDRIIAVVPSTYIVIESSSASSAEADYAASTSED